MLQVRWRGLVGRQMSYAARRAQSAHGRRVELGRRHVRAVVGKTVHPLFTFASSFLRAATRHPSFWLLAAMFLAAFVFFGKAPGGGLFS